MSTDEYLKKISQEIQKSESNQQVIEVLEKAQRVLDNSQILEVSKKKFWVDLYNDIENDFQPKTERFLIAVESQDGSALSDIIAAAKAAIALKVKE